MRRNATMILIVLVGFLAARAAGLDFYWITRAAVKIIRHTPFGGFLDDSGFGP